MLIFLAALAAAQTVTPAPSATPTPTPLPGTPEQQDARCLAALAYLAGQPGEAAEAGRIGSMFYYGKLIGRNPALNLTAVMRSAAAEISGRMQAELTRCSGELQAAGGSMRSSGESLKGGTGPSATPVP